jgi:DNA-binding transcriptional MerR regulator
MSRPNIRYFSVRENNDEKKHIGTICLNILFSSELIEKLISACESHFDSEVAISSVNVEKLLEEKSALVKIKIKEFTEPEEFDEEILIEETCIY